jgi:hypothetical protein
VVLRDAYGVTTAVCTGWTGTGSVPATGSTTNTGTFTLTTDSSILWRWVVTDLVLSNRSVSVTTSIQARDTITAGNDYQVVPPGDLTLRAGHWIKLTPGFSASTGGAFRATTSP